MSETRDRVFDLLAKVSDNVERAEEAIDALIAAARETSALVNVTAVECHGDMTMLIWQSIRDLRHDRPKVAITALTNLLAAAVVELATQDQ